MFFDMRRLMQQLHRHLQRRLWRKLYWYLPHHLHRQLLTLLNDLQRRLFRLLQYDDHLLSDKLYKMVIR